MSNLYSNSIFWIDTNKIKPNPYQPRRQFNEESLQELAESIRQYGLLQPLTVSRVEIMKEDGGILTEYELIAGERRLRASKIAGVTQIPVIIRVGDSSMMKLELAIMENLQREDLNAVDRAHAFSRLATEFKFTHNEIAKKMGRSREYVSNSLRILGLPEEILSGLSQGLISEGHTRPLLMVKEHPEEQMVLFKEIIYKKLTVRNAEKLARRVAYDRVRKKKFMPDPEIVELEEKFQEKLGTRVHIDKKELGGQIKIDFFSNEDLHNILDLLKKSGVDKRPQEMLENYIAKSRAGANNSEEIIVKPTHQVEVQSKSKLEFTQEQVGSENQNKEDRIMPEFKSRMDVEIDTPTTHESYTLVTDGLESVGISVVEEKEREDKYRTHFIKNNNLENLTQDKNENNKSINLKYNVIKESAKKEQEEDNQDLYDINSFTL